ncbi:MAG: hypothetical protein QNI91_12410 [Arenicellales bacterium]|nr:hypothetical protein [Arenicellales bacterium]
MLDYNETSSKGCNYIVLLIIVILFFSACAGTKEPKAEAWVDQEESALVENWGPPAQVYQSGASKFLVYLSKESDCRYTFEIEDGKIIDWNAKGNDCK